MFRILNKRFLSYFNKNLGSFQQYKAFTLAEVLIVIGIIGVIAAITIPALVEKYQKNVTVTKLKTAYTTLYQAVKMSEVDNGSTADWNSIALHDSNAMLAWFNEYLAPYMKYLKVIQDSDCLDVYLADGTILQFYNNDGAEMHVIVYINGLNKIVRGKDFFVLFVGPAFYAIKNNNEVRPYDYTGHAVNYIPDRNLWKNDSAHGCNNSTTSDKNYCAGLIMYDGWQIKDDYPW